ncbi:MAG TPA: universal stress protein, partial [Terriglobia bacterium]|nr:universal stress protein [Terriglobia bacterium]
MFKKILVALDHSKADAALLPRVTELAKLMHSEILLLHVSTGWAAQWQQNLNLRDSQEMQEDRAYLERVSADLQAQGFQVTARHAAGKPSEEILKAARTEQCDLIAMTTHGHRLLSDLIYGETIEKVRHESEIPIFLVRATGAGSD